MRLILLICLTMLAFAGNSVLNRLALADGSAGPAGFAALRLAAGAIMLWLLVSLRDRRAHRPALRPRGALALAAYVLGFSFAYVALDAGIGALILFGGVQITMCAGAWRSGEAIPARRWAGAGLALAGLVWLLLPSGQGAPDLRAAALMLIAALGWGVYSLRGRGVADALGDTADNFALALPLAGILFVLWPDSMTGRGAVLAILSGAVTSGLGYALWYRLLPRIAASAAALAQLSVPVIAMAGGALILAEPLTGRFAVAALLVIGGVALGVWQPQRRIGSSGS